MGEPSIAPVEGRRALAGLVLGVGVGVGGVRWAGVVDDEGREGGLEEEEVVDEMVVVVVVVERMGGGEGGERGCASTCKDGNINAKGMQRPVASG